MRFARRGIFHGSPQESAEDSDRTHEGCAGTGGFHACLRRMSLAFVLPIYRCASVHVFRAIVVSIALMLTVGDDTALRCIIRCDAPAPATSGCHHEHASAVMTGHDGCDDIAPVTPALVRENVPRGGVGSDTQHAVSIRSYRFAPLAADLCAHYEPGHERSLSARLFLIPLRI